MNIVNFKGEESVLNAVGVTYAYEDGTVALDHIDFDTSKGQIIGVIGANGAGKSTLFKCLTGLIQPKTGNVLIEGKPLVYNRKSIHGLRQQVNMVFQDPEKQIFFPRVFDDVAFGPRNLKWDEDKVCKRVQNGLEATAVESLQERPVHALSFGQKKRVAISGILAMDCKVIILDEPEAGLDPVMKKRMIHIIRELANQGKTIVLSTHNMELIHAMSDYIYVLHKGTCIGEGPAEQVLCDAELLERADLEMPLLARMSRRLGLKKAVSEEELFAILEARK